MSDVAILAPFALIAGGCVAMLVRNCWVFSRRGQIYLADVTAWRRLPSYNTMMRKWWIWDAARFIGMPEDLSRKERRANRAYIAGKLIVERAHRQSLTKGENA